MVMIFRPCLRQNSISWGTRAMVPSSFITSQITPAGETPASRARSTAASVCPALLKTPLFFALSGKICPGRPKSSGLVEGSTSALIVFALSNTEIPVVQPCPIKSTDTVNGVSNVAVFLPTIRSKSSSSQRSSGKGTQISPRP